MVLREYTVFVADIRRYQGHMGHVEAVDYAVTEYIVKGGELAGILLEHRAEVVDMLLTEFDEETFVRDIREEGREEGRKEGRKEGHEEGLACGIIEIGFELGLSESEVLLRLQKKLKISEAAAEGYIEQFKKSLQKGT